MSGLPRSLDAWAAQVRHQTPRIKRAARGAFTDPAMRAKIGRAVRRQARRFKPVMGVRRGVELPPALIPDGPVARPELRVAVILDPFSELAFRYEWDQQLITPENWRTELSARRPDLLFVESAWRGNNGAWQFMMTNDDAPHQPLRELVAWCREQGIPTVFWNKEDPPNYQRFLQTAALFDQVFTVDADRIEAYRQDLGHDRIGLLPFGAQPRIHTPVRRGRARIYPVAFAGSWFAQKHPERRQQLLDLLPAAHQHGLHIYSRMRGEDKRYQFPAAFRSDVVGTLPYPEMLAATTAYQVFLNVNSVTTSPTMCARRLFELSAAQQPVLSGPAASIEPYFGDTIPVAHDAEQAREHLDLMLGQPQWRDRQALRAHRIVHDEHTYRHRVDTVLAAVDLPTPGPDRSISVVVPTRRPEQLQHVLATIGGQHHGDLELILLTHGFGADRAETERAAHAAGVDHLQLIEADPALTLGAVMNLGVDAAAGAYLAKVDDDNYYAPHYLSDLIRAFDYSQAQVVGKWAHFVHLLGSGATLLRFEQHEHRYTDLVQGGTLLLPTELARGLRFEDLPRRVDTTFLEKVRRQDGLVYSADRFNFVSMRSASGAGHTWTISDEEIMNRSSRLEFYGDATEHATV